MALPRFSSLSLSKVPSASPRRTRDNIGQRLAIVIDGKIYSAPIVRSEITGGKAVISGSFSDQEATDLAVRLSE